MEPFHCRTDYVLEDDVALLRPLQETDHVHLLPFIRDEPELFRYATFQPIGADGLTSYITAALRARAAQAGYPFIVFDKRTEEFAGTTRFYDLQQDFATVQLGYTWYGARFQRTGLNQRCKYLLLDFAFRIMGMERVEFRADARNARSIAAMKSIGCTVEGVLRSAAPTPQGGRRDSIVLSILRGEWHDGPFRAGALARLATGGWSDPAKALQ